MIAAQHTIGWYRARLGNITGSMVGLLMKSGKNKVFSDTAESYLYQLAAERTMKPEIVRDDELFDEYLRQISFSTKAMQWGTDQEENARSLFSVIHDVNCVEQGSCSHKSVPHFASSPDGFFYDENIEEKTCLEIKCPIQSTFIKYIQIKNQEDLKKVKPEYYWQCMAHMACTDAQKTIFIAYCPWQTYSLHEVVINRDETEINLMLDRVNQANKFIEEITNNLTTF